MSEFDIENIRVVKLSTGEVIIGFQGILSDQLAENPELDNYNLIRNPYQVDISVLDEEQPPAYQINCHRWMPIIEDDVILIQKHHIIAIGMPDDNILNCYVQLLQLEMVGEIEEEN